MLRQNGLLWMCRLSGGKSSSLKRVSPEIRLQGSWKKQVDHRDKILSGLFSAASMAKYYCFVGQVYNNASQPDFQTDPLKPLIAKKEPPLTRRLFRL